MKALLNQIRTRKQHESYKKELVIIIGIILLALFLVLFKSGWMQRSAIYFR